MAFDLSSDLHIVSYSNGIKLLRPEKLLPFEQAKHTLQWAYSLPCNVFFMDDESRMRGANEPACISLQQECEKKIIGKTIEGVVRKETAELIAYNNNEVTSQNIKKITEELAIYKQGIDSRYLTVP